MRINGPVEEEFDESQLTEEQIKTMKYRVSKLKGLDKHPLTLEEMKWIIRIPVLRPAQVFHDYPWPEGETRHPLNKNLPEEMFYEMQEIQKQMIAECRPNSENFKRPAEDEICNESKKIKS
jgi:hypothetical protein